jgi:hypothetical protein
MALTSWALSLVAMMPIQSASQSASKSVSLTPACPPHWAEAVSASQTGFPAAAAATERATPLCMAMKDSSKSISLEARAGEKRSGQRSDWVAEIWQVTSSLFCLLAASKYRV